MNDAILLTIDRIKFLYRRRKRMQIYGIGIAADNTGRLVVSEMPSSAKLFHRPKLDLPAVWDFGFTGYPIYQKTGGIPDIVAFHFIIVRDKSSTRRVGALLDTVYNDNDSKKILTDTAKKVGAVGGSLGAIGQAIQLLTPVGGVIESILSSSKDHVLQTVSGAQYFDDENRQQDEFSDTITTPDSHMSVELDFVLFDADSDDDTDTDTSGAEIVVEDNGKIRVQVQQDQ